MTTTFPVLSVPHVEYDTRDGFRFTCGKCRESVTLKMEDTGSIEFWRQWTAFVRLHAHEELPVVLWTIDPKPKAKRKRKKKAKR